MAPGNPEQLIAVQPLKNEESFREEPNESKWSTIAGTLFAKALNK
jgi:hypothetical protein